jgi:hypothetical protein
MDKCNLGGLNAIYTTGNYIYRWRLVMKNRISLTLAVAISCVLLFVAGCKPIPEGWCNMAVDFGDSEQKIIRFANSPAIQDLPIMTVAFWIKMNNIDNTKSFLLEVFSYDNWRIYIKPALASRGVQFSRFFSGNDGGWYDVGTITEENIWYHIAVSYDDTSLDNDAAIFVNGVPSVVHFDIRPTGTPDASSLSLSIGYFGSVMNPNSVIQDVRIYNRILSAAEIADIYNSRLILGHDRGLVFHAPMIGARGLQTYDGATLGASNVLVDRINGRTGVPEGNPVGRGDTHQCLGLWTQ